MTPTVTIHDCSSENSLRAVAEIYAHHVRHGTGTFEIDPPTHDEMVTRWTEVKRRGLPFLVAERAGEVVGFAYAAPFRLRPAYRFTAEGSIYIHPDLINQGIGRQLLSQLLRTAGAAGIVQMLALIGDSANTASIRLHTSAGFRPVGVLEKTGYKFGGWLDVVLMQRTLAAPVSDEPTPTGGWKTE